MKHFYFLQAAEAARQIKKKITTKQESLRFGKSLELATKALKPSGAAPTSQPGGTTTAVSYQSSNDDMHSSSPSKSASDTSSVISFVMPMSTSTPKSASQPSTSKPESLATSPSMSYPVMSLIRAVSPRTEQSHSKIQSHGEMKVKIHEYKSEGEDGKGREKASDSKSGKSVEFRSEPAVLPVTSSETAVQKKGAKSQTNHLLINQTQLK